MNVEIVGAGPAGLACALAGAKKGYKVTVYEKNATLGKKPCGEGTLGQIAQWTPFSKFEKQDFVLSKFDKAQIYRDGKFAATMKIPVDCFMLDKARFLEEFAEALGGYGVSIQRNYNVRPGWPTFLPRQNKDVMVIDSTGFIRTSQFSRESCGEKVPVLRVYTKRNGIIADDEVLIDIMTDGYFWIFPWGELYNVGFGGEYDGPACRSILEACMKDYKLEAVGHVDGAAIGMSGPPKKLISPAGLRIVGESAGMVSPGVGEGIRFSLYGGSICLDDDYEAKFNKNYGNNLRRGVKISRAMFSLSRDELAALLEKSSPQLATALFDGKIPSVKDALGLLFQHPKLMKSFLK